MTNREPCAASRAMSLRVLLTGTAFIVAAAHSLPAQAKPLPVDSGAKPLAPSVRATPPRPSAVRAPDPTDGFRSRVLPPPDSGAPKPEAVKPNTAVTAPAAVEQAEPVPPTPRPSAPTVAASPARAAQIETQPANATGRCKDGTWLYSPPNQASCAAHGGSAVVFPARPAPPIPPRRP